MRISDWISDVCSSDLDRRCGIEEKGLQEILLGRKMVPQRCLRAAQLGRDCRHRRCGISMVEKMSSGDFENFTPFSRMIFVASRLSPTSRAIPLIAVIVRCGPNPVARSEEHTSELQSLMRISYAVFCLKKTKKIYNH